MSAAPLVGWLGSTGLPVVAITGWLKDSVLADMFNDGGSFMFVILAVSIVGIVIFLERVVALFLMRRLDADSFTDRLVTLVSHRKFREALDVCEISSRHPLADVAKAGLVRANRTDKEIEQAMEQEMLDALPDLRTRVKILSVLANIATLLGLIGTIIGLIMAFNSVQAASAAERQAALASGISQAMYTTAFGISVAVPLILFHHLVSKRVENILMEVESGASALLVAIAGAVRGDEEIGELDGHVDSTTQQDR